MKLYVMSKEEVGKLVDGQDVTIQLSDKRVLVVGTKDVVTRKKEALEKKYAQALAKLEGK